MGPTGFAPDPISNLRLDRASVPCSGGLVVEAVRYVFAIICFGLGGALAFAAVQSMYTPLGHGDNPNAAIAAGIGAICLLV